MSAAATKETTMKRRLAVLTAATALALLAFAPSAQAEFGLAPGSTVGKTHDPISPLVVCGFMPTIWPSQDCALDRDAILAAPHTSQAGDHPDATGAGKFLKSLDAPRDFIVEAPPGFVGNPTVVTECTREQFELTGNQENGPPPEDQCPHSSQLGVIQVLPVIELGTGWYTVPIYRLTTTPGFPASFGFNALGSDFPVIVNANVRTDGDYGITLYTTNIAAGAAQLKEVRAATLFGTPADPIHNADRWNPFTVPACCSAFFGDWGALAGVSPVPLLQTPADCNNDNLVTTIRTRSWNEPDHWLPEHPLDPTYAAKAPQPTGCEKLIFKPGIALVPSATNSDSPTGVSVQLDVPQNLDPEGLSTPPLKKAVVTLPQGMSFNPSAADGLQGCSEGQIGLLTTHGDYPNPIRFAKGDDNCPQASKVGRLTVETDLLDETLSGDVFVATPYENPFGTLGAIYLVIRGPGFVVKLPGRVDFKANGQLVSTFDFNPQLPFSELDLDFFGGPRAPLATSPVCGEQPILTELTPWSAPQSGPPATPSRSYDAGQGPSTGGGCSFSEASRPFAPQLTAGTDNPIAGGNSALTMRITRADGNQPLAGLTVRPPLGFTAALKGIPYCSDEALALAATRTGRWSADHPDCPAASKLGTTLTGAGAGPTPLFTPGTAYLAGPYKGAPLSMAVITPALAGGTPGNPVFDLGTVVVRVALHVDPVTAQVTAVTDPIPQTLQGIPLRIRDIRFTLDRPEFGINPTSCAEKLFEVDATGQNGAASSLSNRFQVLECANLGFKPPIALRLKGGTTRGDHPSLRAVVRPRPGDANIARASVTLPRTAFLDQGHIRTVCTRVQFAAGNCPKGSIYGRARAFTPLLDRPLEGPVYLRSSDNLLPDLVAALRGPDRQPIEVELSGRTDSVRGALRNTFDVVPDAPVNRFVLTLQGGKRGLIVNSDDLCASTNRANVRLKGQNGRRHNFRPKVVATGCAKGKRAKRSNHRRAR